MTPGRAILADGAPPAALAAARSLVRAGWRVEATEARFGDRAPRSRGVRSVPAPDPAGEPDAFATVLLAAARNGPRPALVPCSEAAVLALLPRRVEFEEVADVQLPPTEVLEAALDKRRTLEAAGRARVAVPGTFVAVSGADAPRCPLRPPFVLKPVSSRWRAPSGGIRGAGPVFAGGAAGLRSGIESLLAAGAPAVLVQEFVPGTGWGVALLLRGGTPAAVFVHRRLRELHPAGGPSSAAVSEPPDPAMVAPAVALLRAMGWEGLAMVEFRREGRGAPVLMEVNGRPWGTMGLAVDAGVDFPRLLLEGWSGPPPEYRSGVRRRWLAGDFRRVGAAWGGRPEGFAGEFPSAARALGDALFSWAPDFVFRWSDPAPFLAEVAGAIL